MNNLTSLSKLFDKRIFRIPDYQRGYAYSEHNSMFFVQPNSQLDCDEIIKGIKKYLLSLNKTNPTEKTINKIKWVIEQLNKHFSALGKEYYLNKNIEYTIGFRRN